MLIVNFSLIHCRRMEDNAQMRWLVCPVESVFKDLSNRDVFLLIGIPFRTQNGQRKTYQG